MIFTSHLKLSIAASSSFALIFIVGHDYCSAQSAANAGTKPAYQNRTPRKKYLKNTDNPEFKSQRLKKAMDLADVPNYTGKADFVTGTYFPGVNGGPSVTMQFSVKEKPEDVLAFYRAALIQNKWQLLNDMSSAGSISAMKSHNICQVIAMGPSQKGAKSDFLLRYKLYKPTDFSVE